MVEYGSHDYLMSQRGTYYNLVIAQESGHKKDKNNNVNDESESESDEEEERNEKGTEKIDFIVNNKKIYRNQILIFK